MNSTNKQTELTFVQQVRFAYSMLNSGERAALLAQLKGGAVA